MRTICDVCESAAAILFCAADEAALCRACDHKVHMCNKLASRHTRVGLAAPSDVPKCDICENAPAFFYCEIDGSSLCLQCDMVVHVGGKRSHRRFLLLRQRVEFPGDNLNAQQADRGEENESATNTTNNTTIIRERQENQLASVVPTIDGDSGANARIDQTQMIDLNARPQRMSLPFQNRQL